jgi:hypothetical protein
MLVRSFKCCFQADFRLLFFSFVAFAFFFLSSKSKFAFLTTITIDIFTLFSFNFQLISFYQKIFSMNWSISIGEHRFRVVFRRTLTSKQRNFFFQLFLFSKSSRSARLRNSRQIQTNSTLKINQIRFFFISVCFI